MVIQAKFRVGDPETFLRLQIVGELAGFWLSTCQTEQIHDTYLDTSSGRLLAAGYSFRKREQPDGVLMTLATLSRSTGAIHQWEEWETLLTSDRNPARWPDSTARTKMLQLIGNDRLAPLVHLQQTRIIRCLFDGEQQVAEVRLDSVNQKYIAEQQVRFEIELELIQPAREENLFRIVDYLEKEWNLQPQPLTKFEVAFTPRIAVPGDPLNQPLSRISYRFRRAS